MTGRTARAAALALALLSIASSASAQGRVTGRYDETFRYNAGRLTLLRAQKVAEDRALDPRAWPSIEKVAPSVPRWRYDETLNYLSRVLENLGDMDGNGKVIAR